MFLFRNTAYFITFTFFSYNLAKFVQQCFKVNKKGRNRKAFHPCVLLFLTAWRLTCAVAVLYGRVFTALKHIIGRHININVFYKLSFGS